MALRSEDKPKRVLLLEEEPFIQDTLKLNLAGRGFKAEAAGNAAEARRLLAEDPRPVAVILDIMHGRLDAYRFLQWFRSQPVFSSIPVVILTFKEKDPQTSFTYNVWAQAYLTKPFVPEEVIARVVELVAAAEAASARRAEERF